MRFGCIASVCVGRHGRRDVFLKADILRLLRPFCWQEWIQRFDLYCAERGRTLRPISEPHIVPVSLVSILRSAESGVTENAFFVTVRAGLRC